MRVEAVIGETDAVELALYCVLPGGDEVGFLIFVAVAQVLDGVEAGVAVYVRLANRTLGECFQRMRFLVLPKGKTK